MGKCGPKEDISDQTACSGNNQLSSDNLNTEPVQRNPRWGPNHAGAKILASGYTKGRAGLALGLTLIGMQQYKT